MDLMHFQANKLGDSGLLTGHSSCSTLGDPSKGEVLEFILYIYHVMNSFNLIRLVYMWFLNGHHQCKHFRFITWYQSIHWVWLVCHALVSDEYWRALRELLDLSYSINGVRSNQPLVAQSCAEIAIINLAGLGRVWQGSVKIQLHSHCDQ